MWLGEALWLTLAVYGLAALAQALHGAFLVVKYLGAAYLLVLAWRMWSAPVAGTAESPTPRGGGYRMFLAGLAVTLGNPKIMVFYLSRCCRPSSILPASRSLAWLELTLTMLLILAVIDLGYIVLAARARRLLRSPRALRIANRTSATLLGGAAATLAAQ